MLENIKIYTSDIYWHQILSDLGADIVNSAKLADVEFDDININTPISVIDLKNVVLKAADNLDIVHCVFGETVKLSNLQHRLIVILYKNPNITMRDIKDLLGLSPDIATHAVETAIYELRKKYGHNIIENLNGKYKLGHI